MHRKPFAWFRSDVHRERGDSQRRNGITRHNYLDVKKKERSLTGYATKLLRILIRYANFIFTFVFSRRRGILNLSNPRPIYDDKNLREASVKTNTFFIQTIREIHRIHDSDNYSRVNNYLDTPIVAQTVSLRASPAQTGQFVLRMFTYFSVLL